MKKGIVADRTDPIDELLAEVAERKIDIAWDIWIALVEPVLDYEQCSWHFEPGE